MGEYHSSDWLSGIEIISDEPIAEQLLNHFFEADRAFSLYFGHGFEDDFIRKVIKKPLPPRHRRKNLLVAGEWIPQKRVLEIYSDSLRQAEILMTPVFVKAVLGHELGHVYDDQSISDKIRHRNVAGREAFAELGRVIIQCSGDPLQITQFLGRHAAQARLFLPASRIIWYPDMAYKLQDAAFFHYLIQDWGLDEFTQLYTNIPQPLGRLRFYWELTKAGLSVERVESRVFQRLDRWVEEEFFLGFGVHNMLSLTQHAKNWYKQQT